MVDRWRKSSVDRGEEVVDWRRRELMERRKKRSDGKEEEMKDGRRRNRSDGKEEEE